MGKNLGIEDKRFGKLTFFSANQGKSSGGLWIAVVDKDGIFLDPRVGKPIKEKNPFYTPASNIAFVQKGLRSF